MWAAHEPASCDEPSPEEGHRTVPCCHKATKMLSTLSLAPSLCINGYMPYRTYVHWTCHWVLTNVLPCPALLW